MDAQRSLLNPTDLSNAASSGQIDPRKTTIRQFFAQQGVNVDGPLIELLKLYQGERSKANPLEKMKALAPEQGPPAPPQAPAGQPAEANLESLLSRV